MRQNIHSKNGIPPQQQLLSKDCKEKQLSQINLFMKAYFLQLNS